MPDHSLLADLVLTYALALVLLVISARARVPSVVAMILAGVIAGPSGMRIISTPEEVDMLAEIGIVLLLFTVGLDFSLAAMKQIWRTILIAGSLQMIGTAALVGLVVAFGTTANARLALFIGLFVALSSTAIVLKGLAERNELSSPHGRLTVGILLLQDLAIVVLLLLVPILSGRTPLSAVPMALLKAFAAIAAVAGLSRLVLPRLLRFVTASRRPEAFPLAILLASVGTAWFGSLAGLSMAVGAFLAGLMLAESEFSHQAYADVRPIRDVLSGLFFISLGMLIDLQVVLEHWPMLLAVAAAIIVGKAFAATGALMASMSPVRVAVISGIGLAQVGEFSFILGRAGVDSGLVPPAMWQTMLGASIATMIATPSLLTVAPAVASWVRGRDRRRRDAGHAGLPVLSRHVIVFGFGVGGQLVARSLRDLGIPYMIIELNGVTVRRYRGEGEPIFYGDATNAETLHAAHLDKAIAVVSMVSDPDAQQRLVRGIRQVAPSVPIVVRTRYRLEAEKLQSLGATVAVAEELEASLEVLAQLLSRLQVAGNVVEALLDVFRRESISLRPVRAPRGMLQSMPEAIQRMPVSTYKVEARHWAVEKSLAELNLRAHTGASILAIQRGEHYLTSFASDERINAGDVLFLTGDESDVLLAGKRISEG